MKIVKPETFSPVRKLYSIFDKVGQSHSGPLVYDSDINAIRGFIASIQKSPYPMTDYSLCIIGSFDTGSGVITPCEVCQIDIPVQFLPESVEAEGERPTQIER